MITVFINEQPLELEHHASLADALTIYQNQSGQVLSNIAVVKEQQIMPKSTWQNYTCIDHDKFQIFSAVAGG